MEALITQTRKLLSQGQWDPPLDFACPDVARLRWPAIKRGFVQRRPSHGDCFYFQLHSGEDGLEPLWSHKLFYEIGNFAGEPAQGNIAQTEGCSDSKQSPAQPSGHPLRKRPP